MSPSSENADKKMKKLLEEALQGKISNTTPVSILTMKDIINIARAEGLLRGLQMSLQHLLRGIEEKEISHKEAYRKIDKVLREVVELLYKVNKKARQEKIQNEI